jgi:putative ABC transport system substrate-binding protein
MERLRAGLRERGHVEGQNLAISYHFAEASLSGYPRKPLRWHQENPDLILAVGGDVAPFAAKATSTIPIVFYSSADPVQLGLAASLARPGRNATGITLLQTILRRNV